MAETETVLQNLVRRRVPQITGMYIAAMWLVIELGDWVTERFALPGDLTSYVFVAMLVMLPAVLLVAYNHGAPGRDRWTRAEKVFVPINVAAAVALLWFMTPLMNVEAATETLTIEDETGAIQEFEVARRGFHRELISFFWENETGDEALDWLSYGLPVMLVHDINRVSPVLTAATPFASTLLKDRLRAEGYEQLRNVPRGLAVQLSRDRRSDALVVGSYSLDGNRKVISASIIDAASGDLLESVSGVADNWMAAADAVTVALLGIWEITATDNQSDDPISEHLTDSLDAVRHFVQAQVAIEIGGDYPQGMSEFAAALAIDPAFAEARSELSVTQYLSGNLDAARESATLAMRNSYRLSTSSEFILKANRYLYDGDYERGERVLEIWSEVQPASTRALENIAQIARFRGNDDSLDKAIGAYDRLLELRPNDHTIYRRKAEIEQQRGNYDEAIGLLTTFLEFVPDSGQAHGQLASLYQAQGKLDEAQAALEDAAILSNDPLGAELGLVRLEARRGRFAEAISRLDALNDAELTSQQAVQVLLVSAELALVRGEIERAQQFYIAANDPAKTLLPPAARIISIEGQAAALLLYVGRFDEAIAALDQVAAQLQPPLSSHLNFIYASIYAAADDREKFREWALASLAARDNLPEIYAPIIALEQAQLSIWDGDNDTALATIDSAKAMLGQSVITVLQDNLTVSEMFVNIALLYLDAGAPDKAREQLEEVLLVYPSNAYAKVALAKTLIAESDEGNARLFLEDAIESWSSADENFLYRNLALETLASLDSD